MARGMSLDEFKESLASEARTENENLKNEIREIKKESARTVAESDAKAEQYEKWCIALSNRCFIFTNGILCLNCSIECCPHAFNEADRYAAAEYMTKNKMPRDGETIEKVIEFLNARRNRRM